MLKLINRAKRNPGNRAIIADGKVYNYQELLTTSHQFASLLLAESDDLNETRVAFMVAPGFDYVKVQWAIFRAGGIAAPLCVTYPLPSLQYVIEDTGAQIVIAGKEYAAILEPLAKEKNIRFIILDNIDDKNIPLKKLAQFFAQQEGHDTIYKRNN